MPHGDRGRRIQKCIVWEAISSIVIRDKSFLQEFPMFVLHVWYGNGTSGYKTSG